MNHTYNQQQVKDALWAAYSNFKSSSDSIEKLNHMVVLLLLKYITDQWKDKYEEYQKIYNDDELIKRKMSRERFVLSSESTFDYVYAQRNNSQLGEVIDKVLDKLEDDNAEKLQEIFKNISFNAEKFGRLQDRNQRLHRLISDLEVLNFRPSAWVSERNPAGNACNFLIEKLAGSIGKKGAEFYTPAALSSLASTLLSPKPGARMCDPACGPGSLLIATAESVKGDDGRPSHDFSLYGQEADIHTWTLAKLNMFLHDMDAAQLKYGDTIRQPLLLDQDGLMKFDIIVSNPFSTTDNWGHEEAADDSYERFLRGVPPKSKGDYAFILHIVDTLLPNGSACVIVPHGVLFRGGSEKKIRQSLIEENLIEAVIGLPPNLLPGTPIPMALLLFRKQREQTDVLFIDASHDYQPGKKQHTLRSQDVEKIVAAYRGFETIEKYARKVSVAALRGSDFNLSIQRYISIGNEKTSLDIQAAQREIETLEAELKTVQQALKEQLTALGF